MKTSDLLLGLLWHYVRWPFALAAVALIPLNAFWLAPCWSTILLFWMAVVAVVFLFLCGVFDR